ncbi:Dyp-type peroxidase [Kordiimonas gwangyangensis]|uniref:Dyp-type peroxidase n=1 Tax=Kordiimonas gwangyangensis TaxID=288022 RepID=UPI00036E7F26|nr:Dyp-type peroxidase domain-containing protein [Kordiimonas gwangyangensis]
MTSPASINTKDIQALFKGIGLGWPKGRFYYCAYKTDDAGRRLLRHLSPLTTIHDLADKPDICVNAALTHAGLTALKLDNDLLFSMPEDYRDGMRRRAAINGDFGASSPEKWDAIWDGHQVHVWVGVYARSDESLEAWCAGFEKWVKGAKGVAIVGQQDTSRIVSSPDVPVYIDDPKSQPDKPSLLEQFGFRDGMGNPPIRGIMDKHVVGGGVLDPKGKWHTFPPGEFLLGHIDTNGEIPPAPKPPAFSWNGSFMVLRKLAQDVDLFRDYLKGQAKKLGRSGDDIGARMVGRRRDGTPLMASKGDYDFTYASDPDGRQCPMGAHIRRTNPRDSFGADYGSLLVDRHRILRRAITYGDLVPRNKSQAEVNGEEGQGIMFIVLNASISRQFEFVQQQWVNYGNDFNQGNDRDPIVGTQLEDGKFIVPGDESAGRNTMVCNELKQFVTCRGGDYFFLPGIAAFEALSSDDCDWRQTDNASY